MKTEYRQSFLKNIQKIKDQKVKDAVVKVIEAVKKAEFLPDIPNLKKLQGYKHYYRIRIGAYRIGVSIQDEAVIFVILSHRKDIYKNFP